jgi:hypothetical protein
MTPEDPYSSVNDARMSAVERELEHLDPIAGRLTGQLAGRMGEVRAEARNLPSWELDNFEDFLDDVEHQLAILARWSDRLRATIREVR